MYQRHYYIERLFLKTQKGKTCNLQFHMSYCNFIQLEVVGVLEVYVIMNVYWSQSRSHHLVHAPSFQQSLSCSFTFVALYVWFQLLCVLCCVCLLSMSGLFITTITLVPLITLSKWKSFLTICLPTYYFYMKPHFLEQSISHPLEVTRIPCRRELLLGQYITQLRLIFIFNFNCLPFHIY